MCIYVYAIDWGGHGTLRRYVSCNGIYVCIYICVYMCVYLFFII